MNFTLYLHEARGVHWNNYVVAGGLAHHGRCGCLRGRFVRIGDRMTVLFDCRIDCVVSVLEMGLKDSIRELK